MRIAITGGSGFLGQKLLRRLLLEGRLAGPSGQPEGIDEIALLDNVPPPALPEDPRIRVVGGDVSDPLAVAALLAGGTDTLFHLAAVVSAGAEEDFALGWRVNLEGTRLLLEACRSLPRPPRVVFASSIAVYGGRSPGVVADSTPLTPQTSYGCQKAACEALLHDYSRKGYLDGRGLRLPTVVVRPGKPNKAASGFASAVLREPLAGIDYVCPVTPETQMAVISPRRVVDALLRVQALPADALGDWRTLLLPGLSVSMQEAVAALRRVAPDRPLGGIRFEPDPTIQEIVARWPTGAVAERAAALGFAGDTAVEDVIRAYIEDEMRSERTERP